MGTSMLFFLRNLRKKKLLKRLTKFQSQLCHHTAIYTSAQANLEEISTCIARLRHNWLREFDADKKLHNYMKSRELYSKKFAHHYQKSCDIKQKISNVESELEFYP